ncbi:hypothetical protein NCCP2716_00320 [Sporosarcina sp. NCCP-2716]|uniref:hypothetical protein n=1 Tax=Sporosarcina sp. NCCP-2716 TaxID=2943679 RepID=UPI00203F3813|nr:hypothetical protein [Sporosarcina sp. NCCP-2716]GKV67534.1 hypothetical protein NCCP2716_00320 [Sporosarcina sp. NCCP-2716]
MIRPALIEWKDATDRLLALSFPGDSEQRDTAIAAIESILDERDRLQPAIQPPFSAEEETFGRELTALEPKVAAKLEQYMALVRKDLSVSQTKKDGVRNYVNPYSKVARDGTFYDTKQ